MLASALYENESCVLTETNRIRLSPNIRRDSVHVDALIAEPLPLRNALLALRDCILSNHYTSLEEIRNRQMDPVITVTEEKLFFEAFSTDESSYARVVIGNQVLREDGERKTGCTNIDFSEKLRRGLQEMRSSRSAFLQIEREGVGLQTAGPSLKEKRIEMPDSWIYGFLQVQSALRLPGVRLELDPIDLGNLLIYLKRRRESASPRSLRFRLAKSPSVLIEPWNDVIELRHSRA